MEETMTDAPWEDFQSASSPENAPWEDFKTQAGGVLHDIGQAWTQAKENPAYSTSPQGLMEGGFDAANKLAGKVGDWTEKQITSDPNNKVDPYTAGAINKFISAGPAMLPFIVPSEPSKVLTNAAESKGLQSTGISRQQLSVMKPEEYEAAKDFVAKNGLIGTNKEEVFSKALDKQDELGKAIGAIGKATQSQGVVADSNDFSKAIEALDSKFKASSETNYKSIKDLAPRYEEAMNDIADTLSKNPTWDKIHELKTKFGKVAFDNVGEIKDQAAADTYFVLKNMLGDLTKKAINDPNLSQEYKTALSGYHTIDPVIEGLQKMVGAERAGAAGHGAGHGFLPRLIRSLPGQSNPAINLATAAAATAISPHLGPLMALPTLTNPAIQSKVLSGAAKVLPGAIKGIPEINQLVSEYLKNQYKK